MSTARTTTSKGRAQRVRAGVALALIAPLLVLGGCNKGGQGNKHATPIEGDVEEPFPFSTVEAPPSGNPTPAPKPSTPSVPATSAGSDKGSSDSGSNSNDSSGSDSGSKSDGAGDGSRGSSGSSASKASDSSAVPAPRIIADRVVQAWGRGDRSGTAAYANGNVVDELFGISSSGGPKWVGKGCSSAGGATKACAYSNGANGASLTIYVIEGDPRASNIHYTAPAPKAADAGAAKRKANAYVQAWGRGDRSAMGLHANNHVNNALSGLAFPGGPDWSYAGCSQLGDGGVFLCRYTSPSKGSIALHVPDDGQQIYDVEL